MKKLSPCFLTSVFPCLLFYLERLERAEDPEHVLLVLLIGRRVPDGKDLEDVPVGLRDEDPLVDNEFLVVLVDDFKLDVVGVVLGGRELHPVAGLRLGGSYALDVDRSLE